ncbi:hypothetical protein [Phyllobacterium leguminum]|uniref:Uncharacterized protein n=1 Tax=Phyllobacterium leguminum TaxID=314237 RepID=A0A318SXE4_9HYPH|nr:hypothetical protein [Phyllobacterium leguminum]PYE86673.1 hypothetical protein C7477_12138 [Phyllobacterium leguminum]
MNLQILRKTDRHVEAKDSACSSLDKNLIRELTPEEMVLISGGQRSGGGVGGGRLG